MLETINSALQTYGEAWERLVNDRANKAFFESLKPTAVGWKTEDRAEYDRLVAELHDQTDLIVERWMNGRWIAKLHLRDAQLANGAEIVKIMERRPGSTDATGLDHVDFYSPDVAGAEALLQQEDGLHWTRENNDAVRGLGWISIWFEGTEAKLKTGTVLGISGAELQDLDQRLTQA